MTSEGRIHALVNIPLFVTYLPPGQRDEEWIARTVRNLGLGVLLSTTMLGTGAVLQFRWWYASRVSADLLARLAQRHGNGKGDNTVRLMISRTEYWNVTRYSGAHILPSALGLALQDTEHAVEYMQSFLAQQIYYQDALRHIEDKEAQRIANQEDINIQVSLARQELEHVRRELALAQSELVTFL